MPRGQSRIKLAREVNDAITDLLADLKSTGSQDVAVASTGTGTSEPEKIYKPERKAKKEADAYSFPEDEAYKFSDIAYLEKQLKDEEVDEFYAMTGTSDFENVGQGTDTMQNFQSSDSTVFTCPVCFLSYIQEEELNNHMASLHKGVSLSHACELCQSEFRSQTDLDMHIATVHCVPSMYRCSICQIMFATELDITDHMRSNHGANRVYPCKVCLETFPYGCNLRAHELTHTEAKKFICTVADCKVAFHFKSDLEKHRKVFHTAKVCRHCQTIFHSEQDYRRHVQETHGQKVYLCSACNLQFKGLDGAAIHMKRHGSDKAFVCSSCPEVFPNADDLKKHEEKHSLKQKVFCDYNKCGKMFKSKQDFNAHRRVEHSRMCYVCKRAITSTPLLIGHILAHKSIYKYHCEKCNDVFQQKEDLGKHLQRHLSQTKTIVFRKPSKAKNLSCKVCGEKAHTVREYIEHMKKHEVKDKKFKCGVCSLYFEIVDDVHEHMQIHDSEHAHVCDVCQESYPLRASLIMHRESHDYTEKITMLCCRVCGENFSFQEELFWHEQKHSGDEIFAESPSGVSLANAKETGKATVSVSQVQNTLSSQTNGNIFGAKWNQSQLSKYGIEIKNSSETDTTKGVVPNSETEDMSKTVVSEEEEEEDANMKRKFSMDELEKMKVEALTKKACVKIERIDES